MIVDALLGSSEKIDNAEGDEDSNQEADGNTGEREA